MKKLIFTMIAIAVFGLAGYLIVDYYQNRLNRNPNFCSGNGRLEATEVMIATKLKGKLEARFVDEGDYVVRGQRLAQMETNQLEADLDVAKAKHLQAIASEAAAKAQIEVAKSKLDSAEATLKERESNTRNAKSRYDRQTELLKKDATTRQTFENDENIYFSAVAAEASARAEVESAQAQLMVAEAEAKGAAANIAAAKAEIASIQVDIDDSSLNAPLRGRIQYKISEPGEVLDVGGRVYNLVDLTDVYLTFFLPEESAGKVPIGAEARIILDAVPDVAIPATVTYVSSVAQFTPKTVETKEERQKLMFRIKARINQELLEKYIEYVKTGLPGVAWIKLSPDVEWPDELKSPMEKGIIPDELQTPAKTADAPVSKPVVVPEAQPAAPATQPAAAKEQ